MQDDDLRFTGEHSVEEERRLLERLNRAAMAMASSPDLTALLQLVTNEATQLAGADFGAFFFNTVRENGGAYQLVTLSGASKEAFASLGLPRATPIFAPTFEGLGIVRLDDVKKDPRYGQWPPYHGMPPGHLPVCSYLAAPVISRDRSVLGGLFFGHAEPGVFSERVERFIGALVSHAALAIENMRLLEERQALLESERAARAQAERSNALKDEFLATVSHELRTPLNSILGWAHVLRQTQTPEDIAKGAEVIERNVHLQTKLVEDLLDMSRIVTGQMRLDMQTLMPVAFVQGAIESLRPSAEARRVRLESTLDPNAGPVWGDPARLQQIVWNLVSNSLKFTPADGRVQIGLEQMNSEIEIRVSDTGLGIQPDLIPHIFERFRQGDSSPTRRHGGLGLGLTIVKHILDLHGGRVAVQSAGENRGATFRVYLPISLDHRSDREAQSISAASASAAALADLSGLRVLVVEDQPDARTLVARILEDRGAWVYTTDSGRQAIGQLEAQRFDILICDIGMPEMDGYEVLRRIRSLDGGERVPAIALTAFTRSEDRTRALMAGYLAHLAKPVDHSELIATVATIAGRT